MQNLKAKSRNNAPRLGTPLTLSLGRTYTPCTRSPDRAPQMQRNAPPRTRMHPAFRILEKRTHRPVATHSGHPRRVVVLPGVTACYAWQRGVYRVDRVSAKRTHRPPEPAQPPSRKTDILCDARALTYNHRSGDN